MDGEQLSFEQLVAAAEHAMFELYRNAWTPFGRRVLFSKLCGAETRHIVALAGRRVQNVYLPPEL